MAFLDEIAARISEQGGGTLGVDIFLSTKSQIPTGPGPYTSIVESGGTTSRRTHNGKSTQRPSAQIVVRASTYPSARQRAQLVYNALGADDGLHNTLLNIPGVGSPYANLVKTDGAVAHWRLDETSGTTATDIINAHNGTIIGAVTLNQPGPMGDSNPGMKFQTTGEIDAPAFSVWTTGTTYEVWFYVTAAVLAANSHLLIQRGDTYPNIQFISAAPGRAFGFYIPGVINANPGGNTFQTDQWVHSAVTLDGTKITLYINGVQIGQFSSTFTGTGPQPIYIARGPGDVTFGWDGYLDEVAIYPTALSQTQLAKHYTTGLATVVNKTFYQSLTSVQQLFDLGLDELSRARVAFNIDVEKDPS